MATADVDLVIASARVEEAVDAFRELGFSENRFEWSVHLKGQSKVSIQISTEDLYHEFPTRSVPADVHGILMRVASLEDTLRGKLAAYTDATRRPSKRQKDLADISRLIEAHPQLKSLLPQNVSERLES